MTLETVNIRISGTPEAVNHMAERISLDYGVTDISPLIYPDHRGAGAGKNVRQFLTVFVPDPTGPAFDMHPGQTEPPRRTPK